MSEHILLQFSGTLPGGEVWSFGLRSDTVAAGITQAQLQTIADNCEDAYSAFHAVAANSMGNGVLFDLVTARVITTIGLTRMQAEASPTSPVAGSGSTTYPNQVATVVTLLTSAAGRRGRGRVYLASLGGTIGATGRMSTTKRSSLVTSFASTVDVVNSNLSAVTAGSKVAVQSQVVPSAAKVVSVRVGDVLDTQRRRRDAMVESYASAPII